MVDEEKIMKNEMKELAKKLIADAHMMTAFLDDPFLTRRIQAAWPPVFIIGTPRSGSTLIYQMLMHRFEFAYFPNIANFFYMCPVFVTRLAREILPAYQSRFASRYGFEDGWLSPSEAGNIWNRWFPHEKREGYHYTPSGYLSTADIQAMRSLTGSLTREFKAPFLTKNGKMAVRIKALYDVFPDALFVHITRSLSDSALSILVKRRRDHKNWWSVIPKEFDPVSAATELEQVAAQVFYIEHDIQRDISVYDKKFHVTIDYVTLCREPENSIKRLYDFFRAHSLPILAKNVKPFDPFPVSSPSRSKFINKNDVDGIGEILQKLQ
jgi:hypothetical protein